MLLPTTLVKCAIGGEPVWLTAGDPRLKDTFTRVMQYSPLMRSYCMPQVSTVEGAGLALVFPWGLKVHADTKLMVKVQSRYARQEGLTILSGLRSPTCWALADYRQLPEDFEVRTELGHRSLRRSQLLQEQEDGPWVQVKVATGIIMVRHAGIDLLVGGAA